MDSSPTGKRKLFDRLCEHCAIDPLSRTRSVPMRGPNLTTSESPTRCGTAPRGSPSGLEDRFSGASEDELSGL